MNVDRIPFSVLMSCYRYDVPEYLDIAIKSLFDSSVIPNEIVLIIDGPVEKVLDEIIIKWDSLYDNIELLRLPENVGLGRALSIGLTHCKHELVARMDSDDICDKSRFEKQLRTFVNDSSLVICGTDILEFDDNGNESKRVAPKNAQDIIKYSKLRNPINHVTVMFKKSAILGVGSYEDVLYFEDYYLWLKCIKNNMRIRNIDEVGVLVRTGESMIGRRRGINYVKYELQFILKSYREKLITLSAMIKMIVLRIPPRLLGSNFLNVIYKFLRV